MKSATVKYTTAQKNLIVHLQNMVNNPTIFSNHLYEIFTYNARTHTILLLSLNYHTLILLVIIQLPPYAVDHSGRVPCTDTKLIHTP